MAQGPYLYSDVYGDGAGGGISTAIDVSAAPFLASPLQSPSYNSGAFQEAMDAASEEGIQDVWVPPMQDPYLFQLSDHPENSNWKKAFMPWSDTRLLSRGATLKLAPGQTLGQIGAALIINRHPVTGDKNIRIDGLILDGDSANQTITHNGILLISVQSPRLLNLVVRNFRGTSFSGDVNETCQCWVQQCSDALFYNVLSERTAGSTSVGIGAQSSWGVTYIGCTARGMTHSHGFGTNQSREVSYIGCRSYKNFKQGFNLEIGEVVSLIGCQAGGRAPGDLNAYPYTVNEQLGNGGAGYAFNNVPDVVLEGCSARYNVGGAVFLNGSTGRVIGGNYRSNGIGIDLQNSAFGAVEIQSAVLSDNATAPVLHNAPGPGIMAVHGGVGVDTGSGGIPRPLDNVDYVNPFSWPIELIPTMAFDYVEIKNSSTGGYVNMGTRAAFGAGWKVPFGATLRPHGAGTLDWYAVW